MTTRFDDGPEFDPHDPLAVILRPPSDHLGPPPGRYEAIRRTAARRRLLRTAAGVGVSCAVAALIALPLHLAAPETPRPPTVPLAPPTRERPYDAASLHSLAVPHPVDAARARHPPPHHKPSARRARHPDQPGTPHSGTVGDTNRSAGRTVSEPAPDLLGLARRIQHTRWPWRYPALKPSLKPRR
ncbi:hypothetical protein [Streptomyces sp. HC307]|uniref:hypothetical protein n=1 Tax=Streptomyces flavusporus TaxID=3385496 RepID=UPI003916FEF4